MIEPQCTATLRRLGTGFALAVSLVSFGCGGVVNAEDSGPQAGQSCNVEGERSESADGCNSCLCGADGTWTCTEMACESECSEGQVRTAEDGCNSCTCSDGKWACTEKACEATCTNGEGRLAGDGCNECICEGGVWACTKDPCEFDEHCESGATRKSGCVTCVCSDDTWNCDDSACNPEPECEPSDFPPGECNACSCIEGRLVCTDLYCPIKECVDGATKEAEDGCNTCVCSDGVWACTKKACPAVGCGGWLGDTCSDDEYCAYTEGALCGAGDMSATCKPRPETCDAVYDPVCGCDNKTYSSDCVAAGAGVGVLYARACEEAKD